MRVSYSLLDGTALKYIMNQTTMPLQIKPTFHSSNIEVKQRYDGEDRGKHRVQPDVVKPLVEGGSTQVR